MILVLTLGMHMSLSSEYCLKNGVVRTDCELAVEDS